MRIVDLIDKKSVKLNLTSNEKLKVVDELVDLVDKSGNLSDKDEYKNAILDREELSTTAIGEGVAIPHAKNKSVKNKKVYQRRKQLCWTLLCWQFLQAAAGLYSCA